MLQGGTQIPAPTCEGSLKFLNEFLPHGLRSMTLWKTSPFRITS